MLRPRDGRIPRLINVKVLPLVNIWPAENVYSYYYLSLIDISSLLFNSLIALDGHDFYKVYKHYYLFPKSGSFLLFNNLIELDSCDG